MLSCRSWSYLAYTTLASYQLECTSQPLPLKMAWPLAFILSTKSMCTVCVYEYMGMILVSKITLIVFRVKLMPLISLLRECFGRGGTWTRRGIFFVLPLLASG